MTRGQRLAITLDCPELVPDEPCREMLWRGYPQAVSFRVTIPEGTAHGRDFYPVVRISIEGAPVASLSSSLVAETVLSQK